MNKELTKERKEQIIDDYIKSIRHYLNVGLCEGQANGSFGEDLMHHFDIIAEYFKEMTLIEHDLGIDLITLFKAIMRKDGFKWENKYGFIIVLDKEEMENIKNELTEEELKNENI